MQYCDLIASNLTQPAPDHSARSEDDYYRSMSGPDFDWADPARLWAVRARLRRTALRFRRSVIAPS